MKACALQHVRPSLLTLVLAGLPVAQPFEFRFDVSIGTRPSPLALAQAEMVAASLTIRAPGTMTRIVPREIDADAQLGAPLAEVDFTSDLDSAVMCGELDLAVHSLKDIPPKNRWTAGLAIACHLPRASPLDVIVGADSLDALPAGARVGTASVRRQAQLLAARPDLSVIQVRGTVGARLAQLDAGDVDALVLARAGLERLPSAMEGRLASTLPPETMLPGAGQGIVCAVCREDGDARRLLGMADDAEARVAAAAERTVLDVVDAASTGKGRPPLGVLMTREPVAGGGGGAGGSVGGWKLRAMLCSAGGLRVVRAEGSAPAACGPEEAEALGRRVGDALLRRWEEEEEEEKKGEEEEEEEEEEGEAEAAAAEEKEAGRPVGDPSAADALLNLRGGSHSAAAATPGAKDGPSRGGDAPGQVGDAAQLAVAVGAGAVAGVIVGRTIQSTVDLSQLACAQLALTLVLRNLGLIRLNWPRVRALGLCLVRLPLSAVQFCVARRADEKRRREADKWEGRLPSEGAQVEWGGLVSARVLVGGGGGFVAGLCVGMGGLFQQPRMK